MLDLTDRKSIFYWQTDRILSADDYAHIFLKRHDVSDDVLTKILQNGITTLPDKARITIDPADENVVRGNVNIVRKISIKAKKYIIRMHPAGVKNGYFYVEKIALEKARDAGVPVPETLEIHSASDERDMDFMLMSVCSGTNMDEYLKKDPSHEDELLFDAGSQMANIHTIRVEGFGAFDNSVAKTQNKLLGLHQTYHEFILTGLDENLTRLVLFEIITEQTKDRMRRVFTNHWYEPTDGARLIHNDFADWNLITNGRKITGVLDWDECHAGDPIADLACWSTFFSMKRMASFMKGYTSIVTLPDDFDDRFHFYRLRYTISKMALRAKRYQVDKAEFIRKKIELGKIALSEELSYFQIGE